MDVIGIWARSLAPTEKTGDLSITIVEVDTPEVCAIKREMVAGRGLVRDLAERGGRRGGPPCHVGRIAFGSGCGARDYWLVPGDLADLSTLEPVLRAPEREDPSEEPVPTLVVSELVLSYLSPPSTDRLLEWCSERLCATPDSALVLLEPLGPPPSASEGSPVSVVEGYRRDYCQKFHRKMERGRSAPSSLPSPPNSHSHSPADGCFHPIGGSEGEIARRLANRGFSRDSSAVNLGVASSFAVAASVSDPSSSGSAATVECPEVFDEHAALALHLRSYVVAVGLAAHKPRSVHRADPSLFRRFVCPWGTKDHRRKPDLALARSGLPALGPGGGIVCTEIEACDEASVRDLFRGTYGKDYTEKHPAIRKMVRAALGKDLRETERAETAGAANSETRPSRIGEHYRSLGGIFLVAVRYAESAREHERTRTPQGPREVVGCVGVRYGDKRPEERGSASRRLSLEVVRLAVEAGHRGLGIATLLLGAAEAYAMEKHKGSKGLRFLANTLTLLEPALRLYESKGYRAERDAPLGASGLVLRTYAKHEP